MQILNIIWRQKSVKNNAPGDVKRRKPHQTVRSEYCLILSIGRYTKGHYYHGGMVYFFLGIVPICPYHTTIQI